MPTYGPDSSGEFQRESPIRFLDALPGSGDFVGDMVSLTTGSVGVYSWDGAAWVGPFGTGGGGGGAPTTAQYLVGALDGGLSAERLVTDTAEVTWDLGTAGQAKANVGAIAQAKVTNLTTDLAAKVPTSRTISTTAPLTGGGDLSANRTLAISDATTTAKGAVELATDGETAAGVVVQGNDSRLSNARTPTAHATNHQPGGSDQMAVDAAAATGSLRTLGTGSTQACAGNDSRLSDARAPTGSAGGDLAGTYPNPDIAAGAVGNAELRDSAALSVIGRSANSVGDPADIATTSGSNLVLRESGGLIVWAQVGTNAIADGAITTAKIGNLEVTVGKIARMSGGGPGLMTGDLTGDAEWKGPANFPAIPWFKDASTEVAFPRWSGTTFPTSVADGQHFYHTTHKVAYSYNATAGGWLSIGVYEIPYGNSADLAGSAYAELGEVAAFPTYSATVGHLFGFATKVVGISLNQATTPGGTVVVEVWDDGVAIGASAQLSTTLQSDATEELLSTTIASKSIIAVRILSGTAEGPFRGIVRLRRFET